MEKITVSATIAFGFGFRFKVAEKFAAEAMRTNNLAAQTKAKLEVKAGIMAAILRPDAEPDKFVADYIAEVLNKPGKDRTEAEAKAENAARTKIARLLKAYNIPSLEARGGSANAKKRGTKNKSAPAKQVQVKKAAAKTVLATYVSPSITKAEDWSTHVAFVTKNLAATFTKAQPYLNKKSQAQYLKALSNFKSALAKIKL